MKIIHNESYYYNNKEYADFLINQNPKNFLKISHKIKEFTEEFDYILDVGCGTGNLLEAINGRRYKFGIDISNMFIEKAKAKGLNCAVYDGKKIPFENNKFNLVSSFNVLEHVDNVNLFLNEKLRVLKSGGYLIIACPNFLSITNNFHWHTTGFKQKIKNVFTIIVKIIFEKYHFNKMKTVQREYIYPDDDACNITNPVDIYKWSRKNKLKLEYWSSQSVYKNNLFVNLVDKTILKIFFGSCLFVFKKK